MFRSHIELETKWNIRIFCTQQALAVEFKETPVHTLATLEPEPRRTIGGSAREETSPSLTYSPLTGETCSAVLTKFLLLIWQFVVWNCRS